MRADKSKLTVIALVVLIVVCGGSFLGVRALNERAGEVRSVVITTVPGFATSTTAATTAPITSQAQTTKDVIDVPTTQPLATLAQGEQTTLSEETTANPYTTFPSAGSAGSTTASQTTRPAATATTQAVSQSLTEEQTEAQENIQNAAIFSEGFLGYLFDDEGNFYFTNDDPWQRNFGFNAVYDAAAPFIVFYYDTMRCKFTYDNKDWLIQFWKGQYGFVFIGAEVGVYNKPTSRTVEHYDCANDEDSLMMSMTCYRKGKEIFTRDYARYWWCTGFVPGKLDQFSDRSELEMRVRITMKDYKMLIGFASALKDNGLIINRDYTTKGLDVFITY